ncbi:MAG: outer membrane beta-barrel protein [Cyanobacteria bacterium]|nr:outer membrane beta-barrel protein [Cyanobacteriota bacterium]
MMRNPVRLATTVVLICMGLMGVPRAAGAQSAVGTGPLTAALGETEPTTGVLIAGPVRFAPGITVRELGYDSNVFNEPPEKSPKEDYVAAVNPDLSLFARLRFFRISAYGGSELTYYQKYESERSAGYAGRARVDVLLSRVRPFFGGGRTKTRTRPNGEIDVRADRIQDEWSSGLAFDLSAHSLVYGSWSRSRTAYQNSVQDGVDLSRVLTRSRDDYQAGFKTDLTPLLSLQLHGGQQEDVFEFEPLRNTRSTLGVATFRIDAAAVVTGAVTVGYKDMRPVDPTLKRFRGLTGSAAITYPFLEFGRFTLTANRGTEYSFDAAEAYYVENSAMLTYTNRLFRAADAQVRLGRSLFDYSARPDSAAHKDTLDVAAGSLGYNLRNRTRIAVNYEYSRRRSPEIPRRNYDRRRIYLSWLFAF